MTLLLYRSDADETPICVKVAEGARVEPLIGRYYSQGLDVVTVATEDEGKFPETRGKR